MEECERKAYPFPSPLTLFLKNTRNLIQYNDERYTLSSVSQQFYWGPGRIFVEVSKSHTHSDANTHIYTVGLLWTTGWVTSPSHRLLPTQHTTDEHPCLKRDSIPAIKRLQTYALYRTAT